MGENTYQSARVMTVVSEKRMNIMSYTVHIDITVVHVISVYNTISLFASAVSMLANYKLTQINMGQRDHRQPLRREGHHNIG